MAVHAIGVSGIGEAACVSTCPRGRGGRRPDSGGDRWIFHGLPYPGSRGAVGSPRPGRCPEPLAAQPRLYLSAHAHSIAGQHAAAAVFAGRALQLSPNDPLAFEAHMALGEGAIRESRYEDAAECFARAARTNPKFSTAYFFRGMAQALSGPCRSGGPLLPAGARAGAAFSNAHAVRDWNGAGARARTRRGRASPWL